MNYLTVDNERWLEVSFMFTSEVIDQFPGGFRIAFDLCELTCVIFGFSQMLGVIELPTVCFVALIQRGVTLSVLGGFGRPPVLVMNTFGLD